MSPSGTATAQERRYPMPAVRDEEPVEQRYEADLLGNIQQALAGLQGFDIMALELIQNADDAGAEVIRFDARHDGLHVWNSERFSSCGLTERLCPRTNDDGPDGGRPCNFHAISRMGSRSKISVGSQIGRFGIGFVSVYQVTDSPIIRSRDIEMRLDPYTSTSPVRRVEESAGTSFELPWASAASPTRRALNASPTPVDVRERVAEQVERVMERGLFFLRRLTRIELLVDGVLRHAVSLSRDGDVLELVKEPTGEPERWLVLEADAASRATDLRLAERFPMLADLDRSTAVSVAVPLGETPTHGLLYAYLPTEQPSGLPVHINADFFPHPNRRSIVLSGEQHDRYWNELLLETAAAAIGDSFARVRDRLGATRLWGLGSAALALRGQGAFDAFWSRFAEAARQVDCSRSVAGGWCPIASSHLPPETMGAEEQKALAAIGLDILHPDLRPHWTALSSLGAKTLRFSPVVDALAARFGATTADRPECALWRAIDRLVETYGRTPGVEPAIARLRKVPFALDTAGARASLASLRHPPVGTDTTDVHAFLPAVPFAHEDLAEHVHLSALVPRFSFEELAVRVADAIGSETDAVELIGTTPRRVRAFHHLLTAAAAGTPPTAAATDWLRDTPMLRTRSGFTSPARGLLPGGFSDPVGHLTVVDVDLMDEAMLSLARTGLGVETLSFGDYVRKHLRDILAGGPTHSQYRSLMREIALHWRELEAEHGLGPLQGMAFVRNRAGGYSRPADIYFFSAQVETILGRDPRRWVDENWLPDDASHARLRDLLEGELGLPRRTTVAHLIDRIEEIVADDPTEDAAKSLNLIARHLVERLSGMRDAERDDLERLRDLEWLPASIDGARLPGVWHAPYEVYRTFRASGFSSQAPVVDLPVFRSTQIRGLTDFLDFLEMPEVPATGVVVAHLRHCMANGLPVSDITYQILSERVDKDASALEPLRGTAFIHVASARRWLCADEVFWEAPPFRGRWHAASQNMHLRSPLYRLLDVVDEPQPRHYAALLRRLCTSDALSPVDVDVHARCLAFLAEALEAGQVDADGLRDELADEPILLNLRDEPIFPADALWADAEWLETPFSGALDDLLVRTPPCPRSAAARLFRCLGARRLSDVAGLRLASEPDKRRSTEVSARLAERTDLLLWLPPSQSGVATLGRVLSDLDVRLTGELLVQAELTTSDPPTRSAPAPVPAFYDAREGMLHMRERPDGLLDWSAAFRDLFAQLGLASHGSDIRPVIMAAVYVIAAASHAEAEQSLRTADYRPPQFHGPTDERGETIADADEEDWSAQEDDASYSGEDGTSAPDEDTEDDSEAVSQPDTEDDGGEKADEEEEEEEGGDEGGSGETSSDRRTRTPGDRSRGNGATGTAGGSDRDAFGGGGGGQDGRDADRRGTGDQSGGGDGGSGRREEQEGQTRRSRLLAYVASHAHSTTRQDTDTSSRADGAQIDIAAIEAVLRYERAAARLPVEQSHTNPGFDIRSAAADGTGTRLIEVKGLAADWNERGVKLSSVQFGMAQEHPEQFWIYVVENARDMERQKVHAVANPFSKVVEYWFDHGWQATAEEKADGRQMNLRPGVKLRHRVWGVGTVDKIERRGTQDFVTITFPIDGRKSIPFNAMLSFVT